MSGGWPESALERLALESRIIRMYYPTLKLIDGAFPGRTRWEGVRKTTFGGQYTIRILLPTNFPYGVPKVYVISPSRLRGCESASHSMHCLSPDSDGHAQLCHYNSTSWGANVTLDLVMRKVDVWLHTYDLYLRDGKPIANYLPTME